VVAPLKWTVVVLALFVCVGCATTPQVTPALPAARTASFGVTIESQDEGLASALLRVRLAPTPAHHRAVADEYRRLRILDAAFDHFAAATRLDKTDAAAYDGMARIWRDWGYPEMGFADSARAVFYAPRSAAARNTRGTLMG
jgi:hypothetical protein